MTFECILPIASVTANPLIIAIIGGLGGFAAGMLGIGSGIFITPLLIMVGIPPFVASVTQVNNSIGTNFVGFLSYKKRRDVDIPLAFYLFLGGILGALTEIAILKELEDSFSPFEIMKYAYAFILSILGLILFIQSVKVLRTGKKQTRAGVVTRRWMVYLPFHKIFLRSRTEMSILIPLFIGFLTGLVTFILGGGANLLILPIITYLLGRSSQVVVGTSLLATAFITLGVTTLHNMESAPTDVILLTILATGSTIGSLLGVHFSYGLSRAKLALTGSLIILVLSAKYILEVLGIPPLRINIMEFLSIEPYKNAVCTEGSIGYWVEKIKLDFPKFYSLFCIVGIVLYVFLLQYALKTIFEKLTRRNRVST